MGDIEHAGTSKTMPAITDDEARRASPITSDQAGEVAGEIEVEPTDRTRTPAGADQVAAERGMPPIPRPDSP